MFEAKAKEIAVLEYVEMHNLVNQEPKGIGNKSGLTKGNDK
jgi:hypothetical protein